MTSVPALPVVVPLAIVEVAGLVCFARRRTSLTYRRALTVAMVTAYTVAVVMVTLLPLQVLTGQYGNQASWLGKVQLIPVLTIDVKTFVLNVILMVPLGVLVPLVIGCVGWGRAATVGFAVSVCIELLQGASNLLVSSGRVADVNDLIANGAGTLLGYAVVRMVVVSWSGAALVGRFQLTACNSRTAEIDRRSRTKTGTVGRVR